MVPKVRFKVSFKYLLLNLNNNEMIIYYLENCVYLPIQVGLIVFFFYSQYKAALCF